MSDATESGAAGRSRRGEQSSAGADSTVSPSGSNLRFQPSAIVTVLLAVVAVLATASLILQLLHYGMGLEIRGTRMLDLEQEGNVPTWVSSIKLAACALLLFLIARAASDSNERYAAHWAGLSIVFLYLSLDEAGNMHERASPYLQQLLDTSGALYPAWVIPALLAAAILALLYLRFLLALPNSTRRLFILAAALYVGGAAGLQALAWHYRHPRLQANPDDFDASKNMTITLIGQAEEVLEMVGVIVFLYALLQYLAWRKMKVEISFAGGQSERAISGPERKART